MSAAEAWARCFAQRIRAWVARSPSRCCLRDRADEETIRRFRNEAQNAARLDHPNIARVYYVGEDHGWNFIVFEFIEGTNLRDVVEKNGP